MAVEPGLRVGIGVDAHALVAGVPLVLGGVELDHPRGLAGHSDGDVLAHALIDAILGAAGLGDIGSLFPSGDERYRGVSLARPAGARPTRQVTAAGWTLVNADCVLVGEEPRIAEHRDEMRDAPVGGGRRRRGQRARDDDRPARVHRPRRGARRARCRAAPARMIELVRYADRPDLHEIRFETLSQRTFPSFMHHNQTGTRYWRRLVCRASRLPARPRGRRRARGRAALAAARVGRDARGPAARLGRRLRALVRDRPAARLSSPRSRSRCCPSGRVEGFAARMIEAMRDAGRSHGFRDLIAPVRPTWKDRYPLIPIERYAEWRREDGAHFDPWIRIHERVGGELIAAAPDSMRIEGPAVDWEEWTGMRFPEDGDYVVPGDACAAVRPRRGRACTSSRTSGCATDCSRSPTRNRRSAVRRSPSTGRRGTFRVVTFEIVAHRCNDAVVLQRLLAAAPSSVEADVGLGLHGLVVAHDRDLRDASGLTVEQLVVAARGIPVLLDAKCFPPETPESRPSTVRSGRGSRPWPSARSTSGSSPRSRGAARRRRRRSCSTSRCGARRLRRRSAHAGIVVTRELVECAHAVGSRVVPWTVDDPQTMAELIDLGVDGLVTDRPALARAVAVSRLGVAA